MKLILISGINKLSDYLHIFFATKNYNTKDITETTEKIDTTNYFPEAIIDINYAETMQLDKNILTLNEVQNTLKLAQSLRIPYILTYKEGNEDNIISYLDEIETYCKENNIKLATVVLGDVYGLEVNTSSKLTEFINSIVNGNNLLIDNDTSEYYFLNETDFAEGMLEVINVARNINPQNPKTYTLMPEEPITEIELAHFINELNEMPTEIKYSEESKDSSFIDSPVETNYPGNWFPRIDFEAGIKSLLVSFGIPLVGAESESFEEELLADKNTELNPIFDYNEGVDQIEDDLDFNPNDTYAVDDYDYEDVSHDKPARNRKHQKLQIASLLGVLAFVAMVPTAIYAYNLNQGLSNLKSSITELNQLHFSEAKKNSDIALDKFNKIQNQPLSTKYLGFLFGLKSTDLPFLVEQSTQSAKIVNQLASNISFNNSEIKDSQVLGTSTSYVNNSLELFEGLIVKINNTEIKNNWAQNWIEEIDSQLLNKKSYIKGIIALDNIYKSLISSTNRENKILVLIAKDTSETPFGSIDYYTTATVTPNSFTINKIESFETLANQLLLNNFAIEGSENLSKKLLAGPSFDSNAPEIYDIFANYAKIDANGIIYIKENDLKELASKNSIETAEDENYKEILEKLTANTESSLLVEQILNQLESKNIILNFKNDGQNKTIANQNWNGSLSENYDDYLSLITLDNNENNPNNSLETQLIYNITKPEGGKFARNIHTKYENTSDVDILKKVELILPHSTYLNTAKIIDSLDERNIIKNVSVSTYGSKVIYSTDILIKANDTLELIYEYESPEQIFDDNSIKLVVQKQPGQASFPIYISFNYQQGLPITQNLDEKLSINNSSLEYKGFLSKDIELNFHL